MSRVNDLNAKWAATKAKMLIMPSLKWTETEQTFRVLNLSLFPTEKAIMRSLLHLSPWGGRPS